MIAAELTFTTDQRDGNPEPKLRKMGQELKSRIGEVGTIVFEGDVRIVPRHGSMEYRLNYRIAKADGVTWEQVQRKVNEVQCVKLRAVEVVAGGLLLDPMARGPVAGFGPKVED